MRKPHSQPLPPEEAPAVPERSRAGVRTRLTTLVKRLSIDEERIGQCLSTDQERAQQLHAFTTEVGRLAMRLLVEEKKRSSIEHAPELTRSLLTVRATSFQAVQYAVTRYRKAAGYLRQAQEDYQQVRGRLRAQLKEYCARFRDWCEEERKVLRDLNVTIVEIKPGDPFDAEIMDPFDQWPADAAAKANTVAEVHQHAFRFRDQHGNEQIIPGEVDVFVDCSAEAPGLVCDPPRLSDDLIEAMALEAVSASASDNGTGQI